MNLKFVGIIKPDGSKYLMPEFKDAYRFFGYLHDDNGLFPLLSYEQVKQGILDFYPDILDSLDKLPKDVE